jgi:hypothetical protein
MGEREKKPEIAIIYDPHTHERPWRIIGSPDNYPVEIRLTRAQMKFLRDLPTDSPAYFRCGIEEGY